MRTYISTVTEALGLQRLDGDLDRYVNPNTTRRCPACNGFPGAYGRFHEEEQYIGLAEKTPVTKIVKKLAAVQLICDCGHSSPYLDREDDLKHKTGTWQFHDAALVKKCTSFWNRH